MTVYVAYSGCLVFLAWISNLVSIIIQFPSKEKKIAVSSRRMSLSLLKTVDWACQLVNGPSHFQRTIIAIQRTIIAIIDCWDCAVVILLRWYCDLQNLSTVGVERNESGIDTVVHCRVHVERGEEYVSGELHEIAWLSCLTRLSESSAFFFIVHDFGQPITQISCRCTKIVQPAFVLSHVRTPICVVS